MKLGIMQPYFFPYIGYWQLINAVDKYVIYDDVNFIKKGWINRNRILCNGKDLMINLLLNKISQNKLINEIYLIEETLWKDKLIKTIENNYKKSPYYKDVMPVILDIIMNKEKNLALYLMYSIKALSMYMGIETKFLLSSQIYKNNNLKGEEKILEICNKLDADIYINAIGGMELYSFDKFKQNGIDLFFLKTNEIAYKQFNNDFLPNLSIIDVMMFNSKDKIKEMLDDYILIKDR